MALTLQITSFQHQALGSEAVKTFDAQGGTIGRGSDNDWVLPDPERFVSGCHARIIRRNGAYYLCDLSVNGTFVNGSSRPVGSGAEQKLQDGDRLQIGEYEIVVELDAARRSAAPPPSGGDFFGDTGRPSIADPLDIFAEPQRPQVPPAPAAAPDHGSTMEQHFELPGVERASPEPRPSAGPSAGGIPEDWDKTGFTPRDQPMRDPFASRPDRSPTASQPQASRSLESASAFGGASPTSSGDGDLATVLQHAGLGPASSRAVASSPDAAEALGAILRVVVEGMLEVLKARAEIKSQFRVPVTMMRSVENNPLKFSATPVQALENLLQCQNQGYMGPVEAFEEGFEDIKAHQFAMMAGMRAAFDSMIARFDPQELAELFDKRSKRGALLGKPGKGRYWEMYSDLFEELTRDADLNFQKLFGDAFARAYEEQMRRLATAKSGGFRR